MNPELPSIDQQRESAIQEARHKLELEGWRPLDELAYTHVTAWGNDGFETNQVRTIEAIEQDVLERYEDGGFDEVKLLPTDPYEKNPGSFYVYISNPLMRGESEKPTKPEEKKQAA